MRTTLTLDDDLAAALRTLARERHLSFKEAINTTLRRGLSAAPRPTRYEVPTRSLGLLPGVDLDKALRLAGELEDETTLRELELRK